MLNGSFVNWHYYHSI